METSKLVDYLLARIEEEDKDSSSYAEWAEATDLDYVKQKLTKIAEEEKAHKKCLIQLLASLAKDEKGER